jgi:hypothetical protein
VPFNWLVREKRQNFASDDEFRRFVLFYLPWLIWTNSCQDLSQLFQILNRRAGVISSLKQRYGPLLDETVENIHLIHKSQVFSTLYENSK